jgi:hypothetical protein
MSTKKEPLNNPLANIQPNSIKEIADLFTKVTKYAGTTIVIMVGIVVMVKLGKVMLKDVKDMGI